MVFRELLEAVEVEATAQATEAPTPQTTERKAMRSTKIIKVELGMLETGAWLADHINAKNGITTEFHELRITNDNRVILELLELTPAK